MKIMQKSEEGKVRPVVVGGNELWIKYRKMDFRSEIVERGLYGSQTSSLCRSGWDRAH
ncbi:hypothetical protein JYU34_000599 [Plutella xylostella]|uniref:Uncharacterized protein n=1 Tax=Plutella xylostella TaxID=51655 RepID=A0ABQ7R844_PLUXY|nr:hypothetical protein JYU34_000599 [Plutella xylostella]